ncbi:hypothetical protein PUN28_012159 [Cardiocondyla obscurior]|uniref:Uncharacterized protein n=1 Tax=Cardiocondyla obscurior TaxID=286306 RepID=A0AAW2FCH6_9HYME
MINCACYYFNRIMLRRIFLYFCIYTHTRQREKKNCDKIHNLYILQYLGVRFLFSHKHTRLKIDNITPHVKSNHAFWNFNAATSQAVLFGDRLHIADLNIYKRVK